MTAAVILTLGLGVGGSTAAFSLVHAVILNPLPYPDPDRLIELFETSPANASFRASGPNYRSWAERMGSFEALAAFNGVTLNLAHEGEPERLIGTAVTASMFQVLGIGPLAGRPLLTDDERPGSQRVALLAEALWLRRFGGDPSIVGRMIVLNGERYEVIGVVPGAFREVGRARIASAGDPQVFVPLTIDPAPDNRGNHVLRVVGRLRPGVSVDRARDEMRAIAAGMEREFPATNRGWGVRLESISDSMLDTGVRPSLFLLFGAVTTVLLIACANVANLLLARGLTRRRELALRAALGASPARLVRQLLTESAGLAIASGACGLLVAVLAVQTLRSMLPPTLPRIDEARLDATALGFALAASLVSGLIFGVVPAFRSTRADLLTALTQSGKGILGSSRASLRQLLVAAQMSLATMLLVVAVLLVQSFVRLQHVPLGFEPDGVMTVRTSLPQARYPDPPRISNFYDRLLQSLESEPHVRAAALATSAPFAPGVRSSTDVRDAAAAAEAGASAVEHFVSAEYFRAVGAPLLAGRSFTSQDRPRSPLVAIVSQRLARQLWPEMNPLGRVVEAHGRQHTVVGMVGDVRGSEGVARGGGPERDPGTAIYFPATQFPQRSMTVLVRVDGELSAIVPAIRNAVRQIDPGQPVYAVRRLEEWLEESAAQPRLTTMLAGAFAFAAVLLAVVGVYGVLAYSVGQRTNEIGVRVALGARRGQVVRLVLGGGLTPAGIGIALGLAGALAVSRVVASLLFEMPPRDPMTYAAVAITLAVVALAACCVPAARATRISPALALRSE